MVIGEARCEVCYEGSFEGCCEVRVSGECCGVESGWGSCECQGYLVGVEEDNFVKVVKKG